VAGAFLAALLVALGTQIIANSTRIKEDTALGLLFAPQSGGETRDQIRSTAQDGVDELTDRGKTVVRRVRKNMADAKDFVNEVADAGENAFREARNATT